MQGVEMGHSWKLGACVPTPSGGRAPAEGLKEAEYVGAKLLLLPRGPSHPRPHSRLTLARFELVFPWGRTRVGFVSTSKLETQAILNSGLAKGTEPEGLSASRDWG